MDIIEFNNLDDKQVDALLVERKKYRAMEAERKSLGPIAKSLSDMVMQGLKEKGWPGVLYGKGEPPKAAQPMQTLGDIVVASLERRRSVQGLAADVKATTDALTPTRAILAGSVTDKSFELPGPTREHMRAVHETRTAQARRRR